MKQDRDWIDVVSKRLRDAETPLPEGGWERLSRELPASAPKPLLRRRRWPQYAAAAAVLVACIAAGDAYWRAFRHVAVEMPAVVAEVSTAGAENSVLPETPTPDEPIKPVEQTLAQVVLTHSPKSVQTAVAVEITPFSLEAQPETAAATEVEEQAPCAEVPPAIHEKREMTRSTRQQVRANAFSAADPFAEPEPRTRGGMTFGAKAGGAVTSAGKGNGGFPAAMADAMTNNSMADYIAGNTTAVPLRFNAADFSYAHKQPLSFAFTVGKEFKYGLSLESGLSYTLLRSKVTMPFASGDVAQSLHMLGIPVRLNWNWLNRGGFSLYLGGGGLVEKCISARFGGEKVQEKAVQFAVFGALGAQYKLGKHIGLYFEPEVSYYFTETSLRTSRTDSPVSFTLQLGVRLFY